MGIGVLQLASFHEIDSFITYKPSITYFKNIYMKYTSFSSVLSTQNFISNLNFNSKAISNISINSDLIGKITLVIDLPEIPIFKNIDGTIDTITKFAWAEYIGYRLIDNIEIIIDNKVIDRQYGEFMLIKNLLESNIDINEVIGNIKELKNPTNGKQQYRLHIPINFWFNKNSQSYLPLISMKNNPINISLVLNPISKCCIISPTHYIIIDDDIVNFTQGEYIQQKINNLIAIGKFEYYDILTKKLYYTKINDVPFVGLVINDSSIIQTETDKRLILYELNDNGELVNSQYLINGSKSYVMPQINSTEIIFKNLAFNINDIKLNDAFYIIEYIYLSSTEREIFKKTQIDCHIEQILYSEEQYIDSLNKSIPLYFTGLCKELIWFSQMNQAQLINQWTNYTDNLIPDKNGNYVGNNIITQQSLNYYGNERISFRDSKYFDTYTTNNNHTCSLNYNYPINTYSFALLTENTTQPSGSTNFSVIENVTLKIRAKNIEKGVIIGSINNSVKLKAYSVCYNTLRIKNGVAGLVFSGDVTL